MGKTQKTNLYFFLANPFFLRKYTGYGWTYTEYPARKGGF